MICHHLLSKTLPGTGTTITTTTEEEEVAPISKRKTSPITTTTTAPVMNPTISSKDGTNGMDSCFKPGPYYYLQNKNGDPWLFPEKVELKRVAFKKANNGLEPWHDGCLPNEAHNEKNWRTKEISRLVGRLSGYNWRLILLKCHAKDQHINFVYCRTFKILSS